MITPLPQTDVQDLEIIRRCQKGEWGLFASLVDKYKRWVFSHLYRWVGQKETAEEMAQEVFLKAFQDLKNFRKQAKFSTWLFQITLNQTRDFWRSQKRKEEKRGELSAASLSNFSKEGSEDLMIVEETITQLRAVLQSIPPIYRETLSLRYLSELSLEEIAQVQGEGLSNVKMRVARGLDQLRKKFAEREKI